MRSLRSLRFFVAAGVAGGLASAAAIAIGACTIVDGLTLPGAGDGSAGTTDATDSGPPAPMIDACSVTGIPDPPSSMSTGGDIEFRVAVSEMDFGKIDGGPVTPVGYNLDLACTCPDPQTCKPAAATDKNCDALNGIDNALANLINGAALSEGLDVRGLTQKALAQGTNGLLMRVSQYNGMPDDFEVVISFYESDGTVRTYDDGGAVTYPDGSVPKVNPTFSSTDVWSVDLSSIVPNVDPKNYPSIAPIMGYVKGGVLVAPNLNAQVRLDTNVILNLSNSSMTGTIVQTADGYSIANGVFVGRWPTHDALMNIGSVPPPNADGGRLCDNMIEFGLLKPIICNAADISSLSGDSGSCDALSVGIRFAAVPAKFGPVLEGGLLTTPCTEPSPGAFSCP